MSTAHASNLESLILENICSLDYVKSVGYIDGGREEVIILVVHDHIPDRDAAIVRGIGDGGTAIEHEVGDRMITPLPIPGGPDMSEGLLAGSKVIYERGAGK